MSDLIDRQRAIDVVDRYFKFIELNGDICIDGLKMLPSAQPKMPKWARKVGQMYNKALKMPYIQKPLAWALYQVWKEYDVERRTDER